MTKVDIRRLDSVTTNDTTATQLINENFEALQEAIENTISRDGTTPNFMDADLDLNSYKIINVGTPTNNTDVITKEYFDEYVGDAAGFAEVAEASANRAATAAQAAQGYSTAASGAADVAQRARDFIESDPGFQVVSEDLLLGDNSEIHKVNANKTNIDTVADSITNVNTVSADIANVNAVADDLTNIDSVVTNMTDINNVADDLTKIVAVADDLTKIDNVADDLTKINSVADDLTNIDAVADNITNVNAVAGNESNINAVAGNESNINAVNANKTNIDAVAGNNTNITAVANNATNINAVNANKTNIDTVATNIADVNSVATDITKVTAVADDLTNIDAVVANATNINTVAGDITNINAVAADLANIDAASDYAAEAKQWAIGDPSEPTGGSAKYWAGQAAAGQINSNWTENDPTSKAYIQNKPTAGDNISLANNQIAAVSDASPTQYSTNLVQSGGVFTVANSLQQQIDAIVTSSDVFDIVADYTALQAYDITTVPVNDIVKVLTDSTHNGAATYYRCTESGGVKSWTYVGSEGPYYTKGEADAAFQATLISGTNIKTINNNSILGSGNVNIDSLPSQTGQSGKFLTTDGTDASWANVPVRNIGEIIQSTIPLTDAGLHLLDGSLISGSGSYSAFVNYMANLYNTAAKVSNINVVGAITDNNGVISGFSTGNYIKNNSPFSLGSNFEIVTKITTGGSFSNYETLFQSMPEYTGVKTYLASGKLTIALSSNGSSYDIGTYTAATALSTSTTYYIKVTYNGSVYNLDISTDGTSYTNVTSFTSSLELAASSYFRFGIDDNLSYFFNGSIDLNESYININGTRWWTGRMSEYFTDEAQWQTSVTNYGVCGKFVYDSVNNTVRLPKITGFTEGTIDPTVLGDLVEAGLPNITGNISAPYYSSLGSDSGCFRPISPADNTKLPDGSSYAVYRHTLDASTSNSIYGNSSTVQPQAIKVLYYIVIATSTKTEIEVDIDEIATDLNGKADVDLTNINSSCKALDGQWVYSYLELASSVTIPTSTSNVYSLSTYLPNDGYDYEVLIQGTYVTAATSGSYGSIMVFSDIITRSVPLCQTMTRTSSTMRASGNAIIPVGSARQVQVTYYSSWTGTYSLYVVGYRRIGTNS